MLSAAEHDRPIKAERDRYRGRIVLSVVVPAHNEEDYLEAAVVELVKGLRSRERPFEVIICENGSSDATAALANDLATRFEEVRALTAGRPDYGVALRAGFLAAGGDVVTNFDVDYIDLAFLDAALELMARQDGPSAVVASKRGVDSTDTRPLGRRVVTAAFSLVLRAGFGLRVSDTHGMKVLRREVLVPIVADCRFGGDLFDTELILRTERAGLRVAELGVTVIDSRPPRTPISKRIPRSLAGLARLRIVLWREAVLHH
jgi:glycosyltransferase involved in cell wall biosynthesis